EPVNRYTRRRVEVRVPRRERRHVQQVVQRGERRLRGCRLRQERGVGRAAAGRRDGDARHAAPALARRGDRRPARRQPLDPAGCNRGHARVTARPGDDPSRERRAVRRERPAGELDRVACSLRTTPSGPMTLRRGTTIQTVVVVLCAACADDQRGSVPAGPVRVDVSPPAGMILVGAGNIARCGTTGAAATAALLDSIPGTVFALGDNAYTDGTPARYQTCYDPSWGRHKARTFPAPGNRDYNASATGDGYFGYFGAAAGDPDKGYYSYDLGAWHVVVLNSNYRHLATGAGSPHEQRLKTDPAPHAAGCAAPSC